MNARTAPRPWGQRLTLGLLLSFLGLACGTDKSREIPDVSGIEVPINVWRFEQALFGLDSAAMPANTEALLAEMPDFADIYARALIGVPEGMAPAEGLSEWLRTPELRRLYDTTQLVFGDLGPLLDGYAQLCRFYKHYLPEQPTPQLISFVSGYAAAVFPLYDEAERIDRIALGLDFFLGSDYPAYGLIDNLRPLYIRRTLDADHALPYIADVLCAEQVAPPAQQRLLDIMLHEGKKLYLKDLLLPALPDSLKLYYTAEQVAFCERHEADMWSYLLSQELLYSSDLKKINSYVNPGPFSAGMDGSPSRTANWLGWQIVKAYVQRHPDADLREVLRLTDAQALLEASRYRPE